MPKTKLQNIIFTLIMAFVMVYAMVCYNIALEKGAELPHGAVLADAVLRPACPCHLPAGVPPRRKTGGLTDFRYAVIINMYRSGCNTGQDAYTNFIYRAYKVCTMGHF